MPIGFLTWKQFFNNCGFPYVEGRYTKIWKYWEKWCGDFGNMVYGNNISIQPNTKLSTETIPDFIIQENEKTKLLRL